jgi:hypothetical protein
MYELDYENNEDRTEFMTRTPWLKNTATGKIVYSTEGYPIGDNERDPRWKGYPMSLHFNNGVMTSLPSVIGPTEFYISNGQYAMYVPSGIFDDSNASTYAKLLRKRYEQYLEKVRIENVSGFKKKLKELETTKREMNKELKKEYLNLERLETRVRKEENAKKRMLRAAARGNEVTPNYGSVKETYNTKLVEISNIEQNLNVVKALIKQLRNNIN